MSKTSGHTTPGLMCPTSQTLQNWLPQERLVCFIADVVDHLDLGAIRSRYEGERGYPPYHPAMMLKVLLHRGAMVAQYSQAAGAGHRISCALSQ